MKERLIVPNPQAQPLSELQRLTVSKSLSSNLDAFLLFCKVDELPPATIVDYRYKIGVFVKFYRRNGIDNPEDISPTHVRMFILELKEHNGATSVSDYFRSVKRFFNWLVEEERIKVSPMVRMKPPKKQKKVIVPFTQQQVADQLAVCDTGTLSGARNRAIILTLLDVWLRRRELVDIHISDIDFDREIIKVMSKGTKERVVRIGKKTQKAILSYLLMRKDDCPFLWAGRDGEPLKGNSVRQVIHHLGKRAGIDKVRCSPHTFRHTFATNLLINGAGEFNTQSLLGHEDLRMTRRYSATLRSEHAIEAHKKASPVDNMRLWLSSELLAAAFLILLTAAAWTWIISANMRVFRGAWYSTRRSFLYEIYALYRW